MTAFWVARDIHMIVVAGSVAQFTEPKEIEEWRADGLSVDLVEASSITLGRVLPPAIRIIETLTLLSRP